jgi:hypothetical protein
VTGLVREAAAVQEFLESKGWRFCFIGGLAVIRWGEPRMTVDADLTLFTGYGGEAPFVDGLLERFRPRVADMRRFALENRVILLWSDGGVPIDAALGGLPFEEAAVEGSSKFDFGNGVFLRTCGAEDLIVMKAFADRDGDWADVAGVLAKQRGQLGWDAIFSRLEPLAAAKDRPGILDKLEALRARTERENV